jgi:hypothetical protein
MTASPEDLGLIESDEATDALLTEVLTLMHDPSGEVPRDWVLSMLTRERQEADKAGRLNTFNGRGRWLRLLAPDMRPLLNELTASMVVARLMVQPLHPGY